jgi:hypothetical protein
MAAANTDTCGVGFLLFLSPSLLLSFFLCSLSLSLTITLSFPRAVIYYANGMQFDLIGGICDLDPRYKESIGMGREFFFDPA